MPITINAFPLEVRHQIYSYLLEPIEGDSITIERLSEAEEGVYLESCTIQVNSPGEAAGLVCVDSRKVWGLLPTLLDEYTSFSGGPTTPTRSAGEHWMVKDACEYFFNSKTIHTVVLDYDGLNSWIMGHDMPYVWSPSTSTRQMPQHWVSKSAALANLTHVSCMGGDGTSLEDTAKLLADETVCPKLKTVKFTIEAEGNECEALCTLQSVESRDILVPLYNRLLDDFLIQYSFEMETCGQYTITRHVDEEGSYDEFASTVRLLLDDWRLKTPYTKSERRHRCSAHGTCF